MFTYHSQIKCCLHRHDDPEGFQHVVICPKKVNFTKQLKEYTANYKTAGVNEKEL